MRFSTTSTLAVGATAGLMLLGLGSASAHVTATPTETAAASYSLVTFATGHGCDGSATTAMTITLPAELMDATPTVNPNWTVSKTKEKLDTPATLANGSKVSERTKSITYTAKTPLADGLREAFVLSLQLPDAEGTTLYFPTLQSCETGQTDWSQIPAEGADHDSVDAPAPELTITAAVAGDGHGGQGADGGHGADAAGVQAAEATGGAPVWPSWVGLGAGLLGLVLGALAFWRTGRKA
ncbi:YcnI family protein [Specibacter sp. NPDC057265]|uniref:YcnI family copper-binding membrane protein n=1 Tax=Specibacter sp. NPDC057265 TaxID=3346075 RepID=UPI00363826FA